jgi:hypothetical protein
MKLYHFSFCGHSWFALAESLEQAKKIVREGANDGGVFCKLTDDGNIDVEWYSQPRFILSLAQQIDMPQCSHPKLDWQKVGNRISAKCPDCGRWVQRPLGP